MTDKITLDKETLKALVVDTRLNILKLLSEKNYTLTDISEKLNLSGATVKEHLDIMYKAGLVAKEDTERKWKYYSLTEKGKDIILPGEKKIFFVFGFLLFIIFAFNAIMIHLMYNILFPPLLMGSGQPISIFGKMAALFINYNKLVIIIITLQLMIFTAAFLIGKYVKKPMIIIQGDEK